MLSSQRDRIPSETHHRREFSNASKPAPCSMRPPQLPDNRKTLGWLGQPSGPEAEPGRRCVARIAFKAETCNSGKKSESSGPAIARLESVETCGQARGDSSNAKRPSSGLHQSPIGSFACAHMLQGAN